MKDKYYLLGYTVCREIIRNDEFRTEYYEIGEGWIVDKPGPNYHALSQTIHDSMYGYGDMSVGDLNVLTEEMAMEIIAKQEKLGTIKIPGLYWGGAYKPEE